METLTVPLSWSKSQMGTFRECKRKYFFQRAAAPSAEEDSRLPWNEILRLRQVKNRHLWSGAIVHEAIGDILKTLRQAQPAPSIADVVGKVQEKMRAEFKVSLKEESSPTKLFEHEYRQKLSPDVWKNHWNNMELALTKFMSSSWFDRLKNIAPECWKAVDEVLGFDVDGIKTYVKIDCALEIEGQFFLMDWKTSAIRPKDEAALLVGALYAHEVWGADPGAITAMAVSLLDGKTLKATVNEDALMETFMKIQEEASLLQNYHPRTEEDPFTMDMAPSLGTCERCNFQRLCHPQGVGL